MCMCVRILLENYQSPMIIIFETIFRMFKKIDIIWDVENVPEKNENKKK